MYNLLIEYLKSDKLCQNVYFDGINFKGSNYEVKLISDNGIIELSNDIETKYINLNQFKEIRIVKNKLPSVFDNLD